MSAPLRKPLADTATPDRPADSNLVEGTSMFRLAEAFRQGGHGGDLSANDPITFSSSAAGVVGTMGGVPNPYGRGLAAYEPDTVMFSTYRDAFGAVQASKAAEAALKPEKVTIPAATTGPTDFAGGGVTDAGGKVQAMISAAMNLAARQVPYVWGGTTSSGVDCSGLIYYAARAAGIDWQRYRAVDYGHMGTAVSIAQARPGDVIYYDEPGNTDHVGLYIGNGKMIQAPQSGDVVKVSSIGTPTSIRRIFSDGAFSAGATPAGPATALYNGRPYAPPIAPTFATSPTPGTITRTGPMRPSLY